MSLSELRFEKNEKSSLIGRLLYKFRGSPDDLPPHEPLNNDNDEDPQDTQETEEHMPATEQIDLILQAIINTDSDDSAYELLKVLIRSALRFSDAAEYIIARSTQIHDHFNVNPNSTQRLNDTQVKRLMDATEASRIILTIHSLYFSDSVTTILLEARTLWMRSLKNEYAFMLVSDMFIEGELGTQTQQWLLQQVVRSNDIISSIVRTFEIEFLKNYPQGKLDYLYSSVMPPPPPPSSEATASSSEAAASSSGVTSETFSFEFPEETRMILKEQGISKNLIDDMENFINSETSQTIFSNMRKVWTSSINQSQQLEKFKKFLIEKYKSILNQFPWILGAITCFFNFMKHVEEFDQIIVDNIGDSTSSDSDDTNNESTLTLSSEGSFDESFAVSNQQSVNAYITHQAKQAAKYGNLSDLSDLSKKYPKLLSNKQTHATLLNYAKKYAHTDVEAYLTNEKQH